MSVRLSVCQAQSNNSAPFMWESGIDICCDIRECVVVWDWRPAQVGNFSTTRGRHSDRLALSSVGKPGLYLQTSSRNIHCHSRVCVCAKPQVRPPRPSHTHPHLRRRLRHWRRRWCWQRYSTETVYTQSKTHNHVHTHTYTHARTHRLWRQGRTT